jgi:hypothetical protein
LFSAADDSIGWIVPPHRRSIFNDPSNNAGNNISDDSKISIADITEVRRGIQTEVMMKVASRVDPACSLSVVTKERTLDLTFPTTSERDIFVRGMKVLLQDHNQVRFI